MWLLKKLDDGPVKYLVSENKTYTVGRKNCDITLEEDASISRKHCSIYIAKQNECPFAVSTLTGIWIVDEKSKYGTYLKSNNDWIKLNPNQNKKLFSGSVIKFGLIENIWSLEYKPLIVCTSGLQTEQKKQIQTTLQLVDGHLKNTWCKDCSVLVVNEITLTIKVVLALINGVPIVTPNYLEKVIESTKNQTPFPSFENYRPAIKESILDVSLVSLDFKKNRKELFKGLKFVIPTRKQLETLKEVIVSAGGKIELFSSAGSWERFAEENIVLIQLPLNSSSVPEEIYKSFKEITSFLKNHGRRVIPESEIAQAVAYSSVEKYCNPKSTCFNLLQAERQFDPGESLVHETPEITKVHISEPHVIPCSATIESQFETLSPGPSGTGEKGEPKKSAPDKKRTHSPHQFDEESKAKKARSSKTDGNARKLEDLLLADKKTLHKKSSLIDTDFNKVKKSALKTACITNFLQNQIKSVAESVCQASKQSNPKFWDQSENNDDTTKRKFSTESDDLGESSSRKRIKVPEMHEKKHSASTVPIQTPREVVEVVQQIKNGGDSVSLSSSCRRSNDVEEDNDFADYFEREKMDELNRSGDDLNNTVFSLTLISPAYLKDDGSLIDPPSVPVNVKKFRKQKVHSNMIIVPVEQNDLSDSEWIEPHFTRLNMSTADGEDW